MSPRFTKFHKFVKLIDPYLKSEFAYWSKGLQLLQQNKTNLKNMVLHFGKGLDCEILIINPVPKGNGNLWTVWAPITERDIKQTI